MVSTSAVEHADAQADLIRAAVALSHSRDWVTVLKASQVRAGRVTMRFLPGMLEEHGIDPSSVAAASVLPLAGRTGAGYPVEQAYARSPSLMQRDRLLMTVLADTARQVMATGMAARPAVTGYVRVVEAGACARCVILAGRWYRYSDGFNRHPKCRCFHEPSNRRGDRQDPKAMFDAMSMDEQDATFGVAGAEAIRLGADMARVVNARSGIQTAQLFGRQVQVTTAGTRGVTGPRLMPETILTLAGSREQAIALLRRYGYLL